jgi:serine/threonine-protein kinase
VCAALAYVAGERPAAVLEYVDGETIRDLVPKPELSLPERARAASGVLAAMAHLHAHGVLHGDVHSRNFMRTTDGGVKVIDFGLARRSAEDADAVAVHGGVPYYMPPERIRPTSVSISLAPGGECSEVYQLGVLLFELLSGQLPHRRHPRWRQLVLDIQAGRTLPLESTPAGERIPAPLSEVVLHALTPDPARRPQSAVELARAWHEAVGTGGAAPCP